MIRNSTAATPQATREAGMRRFRLRVRRSRASVTGQTDTHVKHPLHSGVLTVRRTSTGRSDGQALAHLPQSMQEIGSRVMRTGLTMDRRPIKAPYGHRYRHQKFLM